MLINSKNQVVDIGRTPSAKALKNPAISRAWDAKRTPLREVLIPTNPAPRGMFSLQARARVKGVQ